VPADTTVLRVIEQPGSRTFDPDAEAELAVARRYMTTKHDPVGAINRLKVVIAQHRGSMQVEEALGRLVEAYMMLGIVDEARSAAAALGRHFPGSSWTADAYRLLRSAGDEPDANPRSWITRALD
jgi:outer membrane protein assembly factor BamD